ncbi:MAG: LysE family transporter [Rhodobacteraceae bacterium]|nr:LysE family transporter [Paracoccaceae bacterium]
MTLPEILTFMLVASLLVISPGPNGVLIAKTVPTSGRAAGASNVAGFVAAFYLHGTLAILGISIILVQSPTAFNIVKILGATYLCWIGLKALYSAFQSQARAAPISASAQKRTLFKAFGEGFLTNALNPKVSMFYLAAFPQFISGNNTSAAASFFLVFLHSMINMVWFGAMVLLFAKLEGATGNPKFQRMLKLSTGAVFVGFGVKLAALQVAL